MPLSVISLSTFLLYQIPFSRIMLYQIPFSCYTWFRYTWFRYTRFHFLVIPDSRIKFPCYTWFRYTRFCYTTFHIFVMPDSVIPGSVIPISYFPSYNWFRYTPFRYAQVRYTRFPIPAPRGVPEVDPDTRGQENPISSSTDESIVIISPVWSIIPRDGHSYTRHPKGCFVYTGK